MTLRDSGALILLAAVWGGSFLFIRVAAPLLGPLVVADARVLIAAVALLLYAALKRQLPAGTRWRRHLIMGGLNAAAPFTLIGIAELHLTASMAAILNATAPLFTALVSAVWLRERLTISKGLGLLLGLTGVAVLVGWSPLPINGPVLLAVCASLLAAMFYGLAAVYAKQAFAGVAPLELAIGQQIGAVVLLLPFVLPSTLTLSHTTLSTSVVWSVIALALVSTAVAYLLYFRLIANVGPTKTLSVTFLVPVFGLLWSVLFLQEPVHLSTIASLLIILASVGLITGLRLPRRRCP